MPRARLIKPGFFTNEDVVLLPPETQLLFIGLWTLADKEGRLEDRPLRIKMQIFPAANYDVNGMLTQLHDAKLIIRYVVEGSSYIVIPKFTDHQHPHPNEAPSVIPAYVQGDSEQCNYTSEQHQDKSEPVKDKSARALPSFTPSSCPNANNSPSERATAEVAPTPKKKSRKPRDPPKPVDDAFLSELQANPAYAAFDVRVVFGKVLSWCAVNPGEDPSRKRLVNWLNREKPSASNKRTTEPPDVAFETAGGRIGT